MPGSYIMSTLKWNNAEAAFRVIEDDRSSTSESIATALKERLNLLFATFFNMKNIKPHQNQRNRSYVQFLARVNIINNKFILALTPPPHNSKDCIAPWAQELVKLREFWYTVGQNKQENSTVFTYHNLGELRVEFSFFWHGLREVLKKLHSSWWINAIANFRMVGTRAETTNAALFSRHFIEKTLSVAVNHGFMARIELIWLTTVTNDNYLFVPSLNGEPKQRRV